MGKSAKTIFTYTYSIIARVLCIVVLVIQAFIINEYLTIEFGKIWYTWYIADVVSVALFIVAFVDSFKHIKAKRDKKKRPDFLNGKIGHMPFIYITWLIYSILLAARIAIIFYYIAPNLDEANLYGPNLLKTGLSLSSIVFFVFVVAHISAEPKVIQDTYLSGIIARVTVDVLDTVQLLDILFLEDSHIMLGFNMHRSFIAIGCMNMILPTFKLGILSGWHFGEKRMGTILETFHLVFYLLIINVPLLVLRISIWKVHSSDVSVFIIKNVLSLTISLKAIVEHFINIADDNKEASENVPLENLAGQSGSKKEAIEDINEEEVHLQQSGQSENNSKFV